MAAVSVNLVRFPTSLNQTSQLGQRLRLLSQHLSEPLASDFLAREEATAIPPESELTSESKFSTLGADSLDTVEIVMGLEEEFGIVVEEDSSQNISTVKEAADLIEKLLEKKTKVS